MKRAANLFEQFVDWNNLRLAVGQALRGKRNRPDARQYVDRLDDNLASLRSQLLAGNFPLGKFHQFVIHDPKERIITAPCFAERVLHHAVINVCEPVFERRLIDDTYACRRGRGRLAALHRASQLASRVPFFLKLDIRKYFDSVPHPSLIRQLERIFKDRRLLELLASIIGSFRGRIGRGLPIGSLTSQHFANVYLGPFDRQVKELWRAPGYVRYMDDILIWGDSKARLRWLAREVREFLSTKLELQLKHDPVLNRSRHGVDFLGCRIFSDRVVLNRRSRVRFRRKLRKLENDYLRGDLHESELQQRGTALVSFATAGGVCSWQFRRRVLEQLPVSGHKARTA